jgi:hypothetical protein
MARLPTHLNGVGSAAPELKFYPATAGHPDAFADEPVRITSGPARGPTRPSRENERSDLGGFRAFVAGPPVADGLVADAPPAPPAPDAPGSEATPDDRTRVGEWGQLAPLSLGVLLAVTGQPRDPVERGYEYLCNYTRRSIITAERRVGPLRDHDDIVHQVCVEWLEQAGPPSVAFPRLLDGNTAELELLRQVVNRVIARAAYQQRRTGSTLGETDWPTTVNPSGGDWFDLRADYELGVGNLSAAEWRVLESRREGQTFEEIGAALQLSRQRVWEMYQAAIIRLREIYREPGA